MNNRESERAAWRALVAGLALVAVAPPAAGEAPVGNALGCAPQEIVASDRCRSHTPARR
jgi:hypothetical protein